MLSKGSEAETKPQGGFVETVKTVFWAVLIAVVIRTFLFEPFTIPSGSMVPTLLVGDFVFVSKYSYGYSRYSFPFGLGPFGGRVWVTEPRRGDVAVFRLPTDPSENYIKRIVGLPGDRIQVKGGVLHVNGEPVKRERDPSCRERAGVDARNEIGYVETMPGGRRHCIFELDDRQQFDNTREFVVPAASYFVMGDNRDNSLDSRTTNVGFVPLDNLVGRAEIVWLSLEGGVSWREFYRWPFQLRFSRMFRGIE
jgi:signal peptidase I